MHSFIIFHILLFNPTKYLLQVTYNNIQHSNLPDILPTQFTLGSVVFHIYVLYTLGWTNIMALEYYRHK